MANWITVLKAIPWGEVSNAAPGIARSAKAYWQKLRQREVHPEEIVPDEALARISALEHRCATLESVAEESAALIEVLATHNERLVSELTQIRARVRWMMVIGVLVLLALFLCVLAWVGR